MRILLLELDNPPVPMLEKVKLLRNINVIKCV